MGDKVEALIVLASSRVPASGTDVVRIADGDDVTRRDFGYVSKRTVGKGAPVYRRRMCGRLDQNDIARLIQNFSWADEVFNRTEADGKFNVAPGTYRPVLHAEEETLLLDDLHWGYRSAWAELSGKVPMAINTRLEKITNRYWKPLLKKGRVIVPAAGWYEWTGEKGQKQPWHIHRSDGAPLYLAALANFGPDTDVKTANGFTIVTANAQGGMVDVHDRRPVVLNADDAALWLDASMDADHAEQLLRSVAVGAEAFAWHMVDRAVGNVKSEGAQLVQPVNVL